jgi:tetratricopeptide (TPR) repeat protein
MRVYRHVNRSLVATAVLAMFAGTAHAQSVQKLLERGALEEAVQRADQERENVESTYLAAQAAAKMSDNGRAAEQYARLQEAGDESWKAIGNSGARLLQGDVNGAMEAANRAVAANGDNPYAHYQVGLVANRQSQFDRALSAFTRAVQLKPDLAYAHYYAGTASQRLKEMARMSEHFELFLKLAPDAPERTAVAALLRTFRPWR